MYATTAYIGRGSFWQQSLLATIGVSKSSAIPDILYNFSWSQWWMAYGAVILVYSTAARYATHG